MVGMWRGGRREGKRLAEQTTSHFSDYRVKESYESLGYRLQVNRKVVLSKINISNVRRV